MDKDSGCVQSFDSAVFGNDSRTAITVDDDDNANDSNIFSEISMSEDKDYMSLSEYL